MANVMPKGVVKRHQLSTQCVGGEGLSDMQMPNFLRLIEEKT